VCQPAFTAWVASRPMGATTNDVVWGVHTGLQNTTVEELRDLWRRIEGHRFDWISIWDHFYAADLGGTTCLEAVSAHTALALETSRVRVGSLVYCAGYRHPAVLANAIATIDHLAGGRADLGLGAGWAANEYAAYGIPFPGPGERLDILEESVQCVRGLLRQERTDFAGEHFTLTDAACDPKPVQPELPIWIGGGGETRTLAIAARWADGWNVPFVSPETFAHKRDVLHQHCAGAGRDPSEIRCAANVGAAADEAALRSQFGAIADFVRPGTLLGSPAEMVDLVGRFVEAGVDQLNIALRAPWDLEILDLLAQARQQFVG
jgi:F420-dependent oxidoreductase-like protein